MDVLINFFTEYHYTSSAEVERNLLVIWRLYLTSRFIFDVVPIIPLYSLFQSKLEEKSAKLFYLVKVIRLYNGFDLLNHKIYMK